MQLARLFVCLFGPDASSVIQQNRFLVIASVPESQICESEQPISGSEASTHRGVGSPPTEADSLVSEAILCNPVYM